MHYVTLFSVADNDSGDYAFAAIGVIFIAIGAVLAFRTAWSEEIVPRGLTGTRRRVLGLFMMGFAVLWTAAAVGFTYRTSTALQRRLASGDAAIVEGRVEHFQPMSDGCHRDESFEVGGAHFAYRDCVVTGAFNHSSTRGGPVHEGQRVRITFFGNRILKLETPAG